MESRILDSTIYEYFEIEKKTPMKSISASLLILLFFTYCKPEEVKIIEFDFKVFKLELPNTWRKIERNGIDSFVGELTDGNDSIYFDYGRYSSDFKHEDDLTQLFSKEKVNGKKAIITKPTNYGKGLVGILFKKANHKNKFVLAGRNLKNEQIVLEAFKTIVFEDSEKDTIPIKFNFNGYFNPNIGRNLFMQNCASCHHPSKYGTGPSIKSMDLISMKKWILDSTETKRTETIADKFYHQKKFNQYLSEEDLMKIIDHCE
jgi:hypothetical protein